MFTYGFKKQATKAPAGFMDSVSKGISSAWKSSKPHLEGAAHHLTSGRAARGGAYGALGGAAVGAATNKNEYGQSDALGGAFKGALLGGAAGLAGGGLRNRLHAGAYSAKPVPKAPKATKAPKAETPKAPKAPKAATPKEG